MALSHTREKLDGEKDGMKEENLLQFAN